MPLPNKCVQIFPVSVWILNIDLKHAQTEFSGGRCPLSKKSLSLQTTKITNHFTCKSIKSKMSCQNLWDS